jgi:hypothetical protein
MSHPAKFLAGILASFALLIWAAPGAFAQSAPLDERFTEITPNADRNEVHITFRLVEDTVAEIPGIRATPVGGGDAIHATWKRWGTAETPKTAWLIIIDNSDPRRIQTIAENARLVTTFIDNLPVGHAFAVQSLSRELVQVTPFATSKTEAKRQVSEIRPGGTEALVTLIHQSVREGLSLLKEREEPRKAVLLLTDGIDETPGGAEAGQIEKNRLIKEAKEAGVVIHTIAYAERADAMTYYGAMREISTETGGIHIPAQPADRAPNPRQIPADSLDRMIKAMQGTGTVALNVASLKTVEPTPGIVVEITTQSDSQARIQVPAEMVTAALAVAETEPEGETEAEAETEGETEEETETEGETEAETASEGEPEAGEGDTPTTPETEPTAPPVVVEPESSSLWLWIGLAVLLVIIVVVLLTLSASRKRAAEQARLDEAARLAEEDRRAEDARRAEAARQQQEVTKKAEAKPLAFLEMCDATQTKHPITISSLKIGRGQHNDFVLRNDSVSGNHCVLNRSREGEWSITDLNSGNGVVVNGNQVQQARLQHGDTIELGELKMRFLLQA